MKSQEELVADVQKAERAKQILNDPMVKGTIDSMRKDVFDNFRTSQWNKPEEREDLYKMIRVIDDFEKRFEKAINGGKKAQTLLEKLFNKGI